MRWVIAIGLMVGGCNQVLGLDPVAGVVDAGDQDGGDAGSEDGGDGGEVVDGPGPDTPWACTGDEECGVAVPGACTRPRCIDHACTTGPSPRGTFCNADADQCDGAGACVDCTDNAGCEECCTCMADVCTSNK